MGDDIIDNRNETIRRRPSFERPGVSYDAPAAIARDRASELSSATARVREAREKMGIGHINSLVGSDENSPQPATQATEQDLPFEKLPTSPQAGIGQSQEELARDAYAKLDGLYAVEGS